MKTVYVIGTAIILGCLIGLGSGYYEAARWPLSTGPENNPFETVQDVVPQNSDTQGTGGDGTGENTTTGTPKVEIDQQEYDFGALDVNKPGEHTFTVKNVGGGALKLEQGPTTCKCTASIFEEGTLAPGESAPIKIQWKVKDYAGDFEQTATIYTNDPDRQEIVLRVFGVFTTSVDTRPHELIISKVTAGIESTADVQVLGYTNDPVEITGYELEQPDHFEVNFRKLDSKEFVKGVKSGVVAEVKVLPGLAQGPFLNTLTLNTNHPKKSKLTIPIKGNVVSQITIFGQDWERTKDILHIGQVSSGELTRRQLFLRLGMSDWEDVQVQIQEVYPQWLEAELGEVKSGPNGTSGLIPLTITIPTGSPHQSFMSESGTQRRGMIVLKTNRPDVPIIRIPVEFAVTD